MGEKRAEGTDEGKTSAPLFRERDHVLGGQRWPAAIRDDRKRTMTVPKINEATAARRASSVGHESRDGERTFAMASVSRGVRNASWRQGRRKSERRQFEIFEASDSS